MNGEKLGGIVMIKLSELKDDEMLLVNNILMSKADFLQVKDTDTYKSEKLEIYTTKPYCEARFYAKQMLDYAISELSFNMYPNWQDSINRDVADEDVNDIQIVLDKIINRNKERNVSYESDVEVEIDIEEEKK